MFKPSLVLSLLLVSAAGRAEDVGAPTSLAPVSLAVTTHTARVDDLAGTPRDEHHGFDVTTSVGVTTLGHDLAPVVGVRGAWLADPVIGVGLAFSALTNHTGDGSNQPGRALGGYGGLLLQYFINPERRVHGAVDATLGGGMMCQQRGIQGEPCTRYGFFALEPMANLEIDVVRNLRLSLGAGYRLAVPAVRAPLEASELGGFVARAAVHVGRF